MILNSNEIDLTTLHLHLYSNTFAPAYFNAIIHMVLNIISIKLFLFIFYLCFKLIKDN